MKNFKGTYLRVGAFSMPKSEVRVCPTQDIW